MANSLSTKKLIVRQVLESLNNGLDENFNPKARYYLVPKNQRNKPKFAEAKLVSEVIGTDEEELLLLEVNNGY